MVKANTRALMNRIGHHFKILLTGFARMISGAWTLGMFGMAVYGFCTVGGEGGYTAVASFVISLAFLTIAVANLYFMGSPKRISKEGRYAK
jgi:hypothetical protein